MKKYIQLRLNAWCALVVFALVSCGEQSEEVTLSEETIKNDEAALLNYSYGYLIGQRAKSAVTPINYDAFVQGLRAAVDETPPTVSSSKMLEVVQAYGQKQQAKVAKERAEVAAASLAQAQEFLSEFKQKEGVQSLEKGILYEVMTEGTGKKPTAENTIRAHYSGSLIDGSEFDNSFTRGQPAEFAVRDVIPGWQVALLAMPVGSRWKVVIPPDVAYGEAGVPGAIPPNSVLIFTIELLEIVK